ncbi:hypothetical protein D3C76_323950 [compost metagenome]
MHRQGRSAGAIDGHHVQQFAVGLGRVEDDGEGATGTYHHTADQCAVGIVYFHTAARRGCTSDAGAVRSHHQVAWAGWGRGCRDFILQGFRGVAARIGLHQAQLLARLRGWGEVDQEGSVGADCGGAYDRAVGITYLYGSTGLATATEHQAIGAHHDVADGSWRRDVRCSERQRR